MSGWTFPAFSVAFVRSRSLRELPVDRFAALLFQEFVRPAERAGTEEAVVRRQRARMRGLDARHRRQERLEIAGVAAPQDRHQWPAPGGQCPDGLLRHLFPSL